MAYPRVDRIVGEWRGSGARFIRTVASQDWVLDVPATGDDAWVTVHQAAILLGVSVQVVGEWVRDGRIDPPDAVGYADDGTTMLHLPWVRAVYKANLGERRVGPRYE